ncbi:hypothetical protein QTP88_024165 [Uroleucon formosanum]
MSQKVCAPESSSGVPSRYDKNGLLGGYQAMQLTECDKTFSIIICTFMVSDRPARQCDLRVRRKSKRLVKCNAIHCWLLGGAAFMASDHSRNGRRSIILHSFGAKRDVSVLRVRNDRWTCTIGRGKSEDVIACTRHNTYVGSLLIRLINHMEYRIVPMPWRNKNNAFSQNRIIIMMSMMMVSSESRMISIIFSRSFIRVENLPYIDMMCCYNVMDTRHCNIIPICNNYNNHCSSESHYAHSETFAEKSENYKINNIKLLLKYTRMLPAAERLIILTSDEQYRLSLTIKSDAWRIYIIVMGNHGRLIFYKCLQLHLLVLLIARFHWSSLFTKHDNKVYCIVSTRHQKNVCKFSLRPSELLYPTYSNNLLTLANKTILLLCLSCLNVMTSNIQADDELMNTGDVSSKLTT